MILVLAVALSAAWSPGVQAQVSPLADAVALDELDTTTGDLIRLATAYSEAMREVKTARMSVQTLQSLRPAAVITNLELQIAQVNVQVAESTLQVVRMIVEKQLAAAEAKLEIVRYLESIGEEVNGDATAVLGQSRSRIAQAEATINILKTILAMK